MQILKRILLYSTIIAVLSLAVMVVFGFIFQDKIIQSVTNEINKSLNADIKVDHIQFSVISNFPAATVELENVIGFESKNFSSPPDTLFKFQKFSLAFDFWDVVQDELILESIYLSDGYLNLEIDKDGNGNYLIVASDSSSEGSFYLDLESVHLTNCTVKFRDFRRNDRYNFHFPKITANGQFTEHDLASALYGTTQVNELVLDGTKYLTGEEGFVDIGIEYDFESDVFQISRGFVKLRGKYDFAVKGKSAPGLYDYSFVATKLDLNQTESLIPQKHIAFINTYDIGGQANLELKLQSNRKRKHPSITGKFDVWDGKFTNKESGASVNISEAKGRIDFGKLANVESAQLWVDQLSFHTKLAKATGSFSMSNFTKPWYKIQAKGQVDLGELNQIADFGEDFSMSGIADIDVKLSGILHQLDSISESDINSIKGQANVGLRNTHIRIEQIPSLTELNCSIQANQKVALISDLSGKAGSTNVNGEVKLSNWVKFLVDNNERLDVWSDIQIDDFDTKDWMKEEATSSTFSLPNYLSLSGKLKAESIRHDQTQLNNFEGSITYFPKTLKVTGSTFDAFNGHFEANIRFAQYANGFVVNGNGKTQNVDVSSLLSNYNEFGQKVVTSKQLKGDLNSQFTFYLETNPHFELDLPTVKVDGDVQLLNGQLVENKLLTSIPAEIESNKIVDLFVNLEAFEKRLHVIKFDTLSNFISIADENIHIPKMHIVSSALHIDIEGNHQFNNEFDYYLNFNLKEVLTKKNLVTDEYGFIQEGQLGTKMIFLHMYTKKGEVEIDLDKDGARKYKDRKTTHDEINVAKSVLKKELGLFKSDTSIKVVEPEMKFDYELDFGEFEADTVKKDSTILDSSNTKVDSSKVGKKTPKKKKKKKTKKEDDFEDWDFEDDDY